MTLSYSKIYFVEVNVKYYIVLSSNYDLNNVGDTRYY